MDDASVNSQPPQGALDAETPKLTGAIALEPDADEERLLLKLALRCFGRICQSRCAN